MSKHVVISGAQGFIGKNLVNYLLAFTDFTITALVYNSDYEPFHAQLPPHLQRRISWKTFNIILDDWDMVLSNTDIVVHAAAILPTSSSRSIALMYEVNTLGTVRLLEFLSKHPHIHCLFLSTSGVYGTTAGTKSFSETSIVNPLNYYSSSKLASEEAIQVCYKQNHITATIVRISNAYGPFQKPPQFIAQAIDTILRNTTLTISGDGNQKRDWIFVEDICTAFVALITGKKIGQLDVYNVSSGIGISLNKIVEMLQKIRGTSLNITYCPYPDSTSKDSFCSNAKIFSSVGWKPVWNIQEGLEKALEFYERNEYHYEN